MTHKYSCTVRIHDAKGWYTRGGKWSLRGKPRQGNWAHTALSQDSKFQNTNMNWGRRAERTGVGDVFVRGPAKYICLDPLYLKYKSVIHSYNYKIGFKQIKFQRARKMANSTIVVRWMGHRGVLPKPRASDPGILAGSGSGSGKQRAFQCSHFYST